ncbi:MAG: hypothetical protein SVM79_02730 [Chloroflexota bacterium]|nr:hypothetical protein [Chloroflexota bacterium]
MDSERPDSGWQAITSALGSHIASRHVGFAERASERAVSPARTISLKRLGIPNLVQRVSDRTRWSIALADRVGRLSHQNSLSRQSTESYSGRPDMFWFNRERVSRSPFEDGSPEPYYEEPGVFSRTTNQQAPSEHIPGESSAQHRTSTAELTRKMEPALPARNAIASRQPSLPGKAIQFARAHHERMQKSPTVASSGPMLQSMGLLSSSPFTKEESDPMPSSQSLPTQISIGAKSIEQAKIMHRKSATGEGAHLQTWIATTEGRQSKPTTSESVHTQTQSIAQSQQGKPVSIPVIPEVSGVLQTSPSEFIPSSVQERSEPEALLPTIPKGETFTQGTPSPSQRPAILPRIPFIGSIARKALNAVRPKPSTKTSSQNWGQRSLDTPLVSAGKRTQPGETPIQQSPERAPSSVSLKPDSVTADESRLSRAADSAPVTGKKSIAKTQPIIARESLTGKAPEIAPVVGKEPLSKTQSPAVPTPVFRKQAARQAGASREKQEIVSTEADKVYSDTSQAMSVPPLMATQPPDTSDVTTAARSIQKKEGIAKQIFDKYSSHDQIAHTMPAKHLPLIQRSTVSKSAEANALSKSTETASDELASRITRKHQPADESLAAPASGEGLPVIQRSPVSKPLEPAHEGVSAQFPVESLSGAISRKYYSKDSIIAPMQSAHMTHSGGTSTPHAPGLSGMQGTLGNQPNEETVFQKYDEPLSRKSERALPTLFHTGSIPSPKTTRETAAYPNASKEYSDIMFDSKHTTAQSISRRSIQRTQAPAELILAVPGGRKALGNAPSEHIALDTISRSIADGPVAGAEQSNTQDNSQGGHQDPEAFAREIYTIIKRRLVIEKERIGHR